MAEVELTEDDVQAKMEELIFRMIDGQGLGKVIARATMIGLKVVFDPVPGDPIHIRVSLERVIGEKTIHIRYIVDIQFLLES
jgi:hypothetical protein